MPRQSGDPGRNCPRCPRLVAFRKSWRAREPQWFNAPVISFGPLDARLLIVGLAPGQRGANRTGRPFTGDSAGDLLYAVLAEFGFAEGHYQARPDDGLILTDCRITNAVRCVPPQNKPTPAEIATCRQFLAATMMEMPQLRAVLALGRIAHDAVVVACGRKRSAYPFSHGAVQALDGIDIGGCNVGAFNMGGLKLFDSYHCSRLNTNTGVLTPKMFRKVFAGIRADLDGKRSGTAAVRAGAS
jgi:uracil-DNA glycosylase